jgi:hypothetical protein
MITQLLFLFAEVAVNWSPITDLEKNNLLPSAAIARVVFTAADMILQTVHDRDAKRIESFLLSEECHEAVLKTNEVRGISCLHAVKDRRRWLASRLTVRMYRLEGRGKNAIFTRGRFVLVRIDKCPEEDGIVILRALAKLYADDSPPFLGRSRNRPWLHRVPRGAHGKLSK